MKFGTGLENLPPHQQPDSSQKALELMKEWHDNTYVYASNFTSWTGYRATTRIHVEKGVAAAYLDLGSPFQRVD